MRTIRVKILAAIGVCSLVLCGMIGGLSIVNSTRMANQSADENMSLQCSNTATQLNGSISRIEQSVDTFSTIAMSYLEDIDTFMTDGSYVKEYTEKLEPLALEFARNTEGALSCYVRYNPEFTEPTSGVFYSRPDGSSDFDKLAPTDFSMYEPSDVSHVGWYYIPVQARQPTWMAPYLNSNINVYMISYVIPLYKDGVSVGIIGMDIDFSAIEELILETKLYDSGYAFLVNGSGQIMSHPSLEFGTELSALDGGKPIVDILDNPDRSGRLTQYKYEGISKNIAYSPLDNGMKLVLTAPSSEIEADSHTLAFRIIMISVVGLIIALFVGFILSIRLSGPIKKLTGVLTKTARFDFTSTPGAARLYKNKDETGKMAVEVHNMRDKLREMVRSIENAQMTIAENVNALKETADVVNSMCSENAETAEIMVAGTQETSASTQTISENIGNVKAGISDIHELSLSGDELSDEILTRAGELQISTKRSSEQTKSMYLTVREKTDQAMEQAKAVARINELTDGIMDISENTGLLSLNASIEAARAGEAGRGFAVVATEIGKLAGQTSQMVSDIDTIVGEVNKAVTNMAQCLQESIEFLEHTVLADYLQFQKVSEQYSRDASVYKNSMHSINQAINVLSSNITEIADSITDINSVMGETTNGITGISEKTNAMEEKTGKASRLVQESMESVETLKKIVETFVLE